MRVYRETIEVEVDGNRPKVIRWRKRFYHVITMIDCWVYEGRWWSRPERRVYMRLVTDRGVLEVYRVGGEWKMSRVFD